jgi:hypothetical protein
MALGGIGRDVGVSANPKLRIGYGLQRMEKTQVGHK